MKKELVGNIVMVNLIQGGKKKMTKSEYRPRFCPGCGKPLADDGRNWVQEMVPAKEGQELYDCFCDECGWSGDISPDVDIMEEAGKEVDVNE